MTSTIGFESVKAETRWSSCWSVTASWTSLALSSGLKNEEPESRRKSSLSSADGSPTRAAAAGATSLIRLAATHADDFPTAGTARKSPYYQQMSRRAAYAAMLVEHRKQ